MQGSLSRFIDALAASVDAVSLHDALAHVGVDLGLPLFAYFHISKQRRAPPTLISNYQREWTNRYVDRRYDHLDPVIRYARILTEPFPWDPKAENARSTPRQREFFEEAKAFGIGSGFTIPIVSDARQFSAVTFASDAGAREVQRLITSHGSALHLISLLFHRRAEALASGGGQVAGVLLTRREVECLTWAMRGKSTWDTAQIVGIKPRTVTYHLDHVREKLEVKTITQAVAIFAQAQREQTS